MSLPQPNITPGSVLPGNMVGDYVFFDDFFAASLTAGGEFVQDADTAAWKVTDDVNSTYAVSDAERGGVLLVTTGANANDFSSAQMTGSGLFVVTAGKDIYWEMRVKFGDADDTRWILGLATEDVTGTTLGPILDSVGSENSHIGFIQNGDTDSDIEYTVQNGGTQTTGDTGIDVADDTYVKLAFWVHGTTSVDFYVNGVRKATVTTNIPNGDDLTPSMEIHSPTASSTMEVDYIYVSQTR
jgi:hypothetical protein